MARRGRATDVFMDRIPRGPVPREASVPRTLRLPTPDETQRGIVIAWAPANFGVYRAVIERMQPHERFRIETQFGAYEMSAGEFEATFPGILRSASYQTGSPRQHGRCVYVVGPPPADAKQFKV
jgi:hypothetical protein